MSEVPLYPSELENAAQALGSGAYAAHGAGTSPLTLQPRNGP